MSDKGWQKFIKLCSEARKAELLEALLTFFFTDEEQAQMAKRILLVQELLKGENSQREIAKNLEVSISKITRGSNSLKHIDPALKEFLLKQLAGSMNNYLSR